MFYFAAVVLGLLIIVIIFVVVVRWRRRKRRQQGLQAGPNNRDNEFIYDDLKRQKMTNVEANMVQNIPASPRNIPPSPHRNVRPPPVPTRPASYTPSTADSINTLNNFDTLHNYGSAADELENVGTLPHIEIPEFLQNLDVEKSPAPIRSSSLPPPPPLYEEDLKQRKANNWDHNNPNIATKVPEGNS